MLLALLVLVSHSWLLALGQPKSEPLLNTFGNTLGTFCVFGFFLISGFLVTQSYFRRHDVPAFLAARFLRIFPGLAVALLITALILGSFATTLSIASYLSDPKTWLFVIRNLTLVSMQSGLPGVFEHLPYKNYVNGSLWTLYYEVACYGILSAVAALGFFRNSKRILIALSAVATLLFAGHISEGFLHGQVENFERLAPFFAAGVSLFFLRNHIRLSRLLAALAVAVAAVIAVKVHILPPLLIAFCYAIIAFGYRRSATMSIYNRVGDYSYGTYIYAYPVQQFLINFFPGITPFQLIISSFPATLSLAILSWHCIERPALALKNRFGRELRHLSSDAVAR